MSSVFDAYHAWLGIPPAEQPPTYYRVLGLALYETDPAAIQGACDRQLARLPTSPDDPHAALAEKLRQQIKAVCAHLLNPDKKAAYDSAMRQKAAKAAAATSSSAVGQKPPAAESGGQQSQAAPAPQVDVAGVEKAGSRQKIKTLGEYDILTKIGSGGMGQVYKAKHRRMHRIVALKVLAPQALRSPDALRRFEREAQAAARLSHPNIVTAYDAGEQHGIHYLVMEYVDGTDLASLVENHGPLDIESALECTIQAARGLQYAHNEGVIHRDIKPANLLLDKSGTIKILDMGLARMDDVLAPGEDAGAAGLTASGQILGTVDYMSPEQAEDTRGADVRSDVYSLGCTFCRLLTGKAPYGGDTVMKRLLAHRSQEIPSLAARRSEVSRDLDTVFHRMVAKDPKERFQTMAEVIAALEGCRAGKPVAAVAGTSAAAGHQRSLLGALVDVVRRAEPHSLSPGSGSNDVTVSSRQEETSPSLLGKLASTARRNPKAAVAGGTCTALIAVAALAFWLFSGNRNPIPDQAVARSENPASATTGSDDGKKTASESGGKADVAKTDQAAASRQAEEILKMVTPVEPGKDVVLNTLEKSAKMVEVLTNSKSEKAETGVNSKSPSSGSAAPPATLSPDLIKLAENQWVDLLPLADLAQDASTADWQRAPGGVTSSSKEQTILQLPAQIDGSYDVQVKVFRTGPAGAGIVLPLGDTWLALTLSSQDDKYAGLGLIEGKGVEDPANPTQKISPLAANRWQTVEIHVWRLGEEARIAAEVDSKPFVNWKGKISDVSVASQWRPKQTKRAALASWNNPKGNVTFGTARLRVTDGIAGVRRGAVPNLPGPWLDVLPLVDVQKDSVEAAWRNSSGAIISTTEATSRLALPVDPQGDYVLSAKFIRRSGNASINVIFALPENRQSLGILSGHPALGIRSALVPVRGAGVQGDNPTVSSNLRVEDGKTYQLIAQVVTHGTEAEINVYVDGEPVISYSGPSGALGLQPIWRLRDGERLGLGSNVSSVEYRDVQLQMLTGKAVLLRAPPAGAKLPDFVSLPSQQSVTASKTATPSAGEIAAQQKTAAPTPPKVLGPFTQSVAANQAIDLLQLPDATNDSSTHDWQMSEEGASTSKLSPSLLSLPVLVDGDYDLQVKFRRSGPSNAVVVLPIGNTWAEVVLADWAKNNAGLEVIDGKGAGDPANPTGQHLDPIYNQWQTLSVQVRRKAKTVQIIAELDKQPFVNWQGNEGQLSAYANCLPQLAMRPVICSLNHPNGSVTFSEAQFKLISGTAKVRRSTPPTKIANEWLDLLPLVDPAVDQLKGNWRMQGGELQYAGDTDRARVEFPVALSGSYRVQIEFQTLAEANSISMVLLAGGRRVRCALDGLNGTSRISGLESIKGLPPTDRLNPTATNQFKLVDRTWHTADATVKFNGTEVNIAVNADNSPLFTWQGPSTDLWMDGTWVLKRFDTLGFGGWNKPILVKAAKLQVLDGGTAMLLRPAPRGVRLPSFATVSGK